MAEHGWQWQTRVSVPAAGTLAVTLPSGRPLLEHLTVWASSGARVLTNMSCQPRINQKNFGAAVAFVAVRAADPIYDSAAVARMTPVGVNALATADPFVFDVLLTNAGGAAETVTLYFTAIGRDGGPQ